MNTMLAATAESFSAADPLSGLVVGPRPLPEELPGWKRVRVTAAALNHHDLWSLRGVGLRPEQLPMILGGDGAGVDEDGNEVIIHSVIGDPDAGRGDETLDPARSLLSERYPGTLAEWVAVPSRNLVPKPPSLTWEQAACLPTAWLTAYRMVFTKSGLRARDSLLVQGAGGGVATAAIILAHALGVRVFVTGRDAQRLERTKQLGAEQTFSAGARLPERVDVVIDTVGEATWSHSLKALRPGGILLTCGATSGPNPAAQLNRVFFLQLNILGSTMGSREELVQLAQFCVDHDVTPLVDSVHPLAEARAAFERLETGESFGKVVLRCDNS